MAENIVLSFALLFGAVIALICAVYVALETRRKRIRLAQEQNQEMIDNTQEVEEVKDFIE